MHPNVIRASPTTVLSDEQYVYGHVLEALTGGLYPNKLDVLREYVQNAYDAIREYRLLGENPNECSIRIYTRAGSVLIYDNATGMDLNTLQEYRKLGFSKKPLGQYAGWRGIGKAAGLAVAEKLIVTTHPLGRQEAHQLEFRAAEMLKVVREFRSKGENIPLNQLIQQYSNIESCEESKKKHYTTVELCKINPDSKELLDEHRLIAHLSQISPVPFCPDFQFAKKITRNLAQHIEDYLPVKMFVNGEQIYKPYRNTWGPRDDRMEVEEPEFLPVYDQEDLVAYCWYCMNAGKGQINRPVVVARQLVDISGLVYRIDDIRIGDAQLVRRTAWTASPERAFYAMGEIHILDPRIEPTSDRNDLQDNFARLQLYNRCNNIIAGEINRKAGRHSAELRAEEKISQDYDIIGDLQRRMKRGRVQKELVPHVIYKATLVKEDVQKRKRYAVNTQTIKKAERIVRIADGILRKMVPLTSPDVSEQDLAKTVLDFPREMNLSNETTAVYNSVMRVLRDFFLNDPDIYEELVQRIQQDLRRAFTK